MALLRVGEGCTENIDIEKLSKNISTLIKEKGFSEIVFHKDEKNVEIILGSGESIKIECGCVGIPFWWNYYFSVEVL